MAGDAFSQALAGARRTGQRALVPYALLGLAVVCARAAIKAGVGGAGVGGAGGLALDAAVLLGASRALFAELGAQPEQTEAELDASAEKDLVEVLGLELSVGLARGAGPRRATQRRKVGQGAERRQRSLRLI